MEIARTFILLVEGRTDAVLYKTLIEKVTDCREYGIEYLNYSIRMLLSKIMVHKRDFIVLKMKSKILVIIDCRGYDRLKYYLRELIDNDYFIESMDNGLVGIIVAANKDKSPMDSIYGILTSLGCRISRNSYCFKIAVMENRYFPIYIIEQGFKDGVRAIEDELDQLAEQLDPVMAKAINTVEKILKIKLLPTQRLGIIEAIKVNNNGLPALIPKLIEEASLKN